MFNFVESLYFMRRMDTKQFDCLQDRLDIKKVTGPEVSADLEKPEHEDPTDRLPSDEGPGPCHVPGQSHDGGGGGRVDNS